MLAPVPNSNPPETSYTVTMLAPVTNSNPPKTSSQLDDFSKLCHEIGRDRGKRVSTLLHGGWADMDLTEARFSLSQTEERLRIRAETRRDASRLCGLVARMMKPPNSRVESIQHKSGVTLTRRTCSSENHVVDTLTSVSDRYRDKLSRSIVSSPAKIVRSCAGKLESWLTESLPQEQKDSPALSDWVIGDSTLVYWCRRWHTSSLMEIGGQGDGTVQLRLRPSGFDSTSDVWIRDADWERRLRPVFVTAQGGGRLERGHCGHPGDFVKVNWFDCSEHGYWVDTQLLGPVGRVISRQHAKHDSVEVEVITLALTETVCCSNEMLRAVGKAEFEATAAHVQAIRAETRRLLDAFHAEAAIGPQPQHLRCDHLESSEESSDLGNCRLSDAWMVWQGLRVISGRRSLIAVLRLGGSLVGRDAQGYEASQCLPSWIVRMHCPVSRQWTTSHVPPKIYACAAEKALAGSKDAGWGVEKKTTRLIAVNVLDHLHVRSGTLEWMESFTRVPLVGSTAPQHSPPPRPSPERCMKALPASFPCAEMSHSDEPLHSLSNLSLSEALTCDVSLVGGRRGGGGHVDSDEDSVRLVVCVHPPPSAATRMPPRIETLVVEAADWQWVRPWGVNAGALPGLRWLTPALRIALLHSLVARLDAHDGSIVCRLPHRTIFPLGFVPFRARPPPSGEKAWAQMPPRQGKKIRGGVVWRASVSLETFETLDTMTTGEGSARGVSGRWMASTRAEDHTLSVKVLGVGPYRNQRADVSLTVADWACLGFGPLQHLSLEQQQHLSRRLFFPGAMRLVLQPGGDGRLSIEVQLQAKVEMGDGRFLQDRGESIAVGTRPSLEIGGPTKLLLLCARDLHDFIPSLQRSPSEDGPLDYGLSAPIACGLSALRKRHHRHPGVTKDEVAVDDEDADSAWEEARKWATLRDMEPHQRLALLHRLRISLLSSSSSPSFSSSSPHAFVGPPSDEATSSALVVYPHSCPPPMPSSLSHLDIVTTNLDNSFHVSISPPAPLCPGGGALSSFTLNFLAPSPLSPRASRSDDVLLDGIGPQPERSSTGVAKTLLLYEVELVVSARGGERHLVALLEHELEPDLTRLWHQSEYSDDKGTLLLGLVKVLQKRAGESNREAVKCVALGASAISFPSTLPTHPVPILLRQVPVNFTRSDPLVLSAFDTGRGVLLVAEKEVGAEYREQMEAELDRHRERVNRDDTTQPGALGGSKTTARKLEKAIEERQSRLAAASSASGALAGEGALGVGTLREPPTQLPTSGGQQTSSLPRVCVSSAEIPTAKFGASREPLLMSPSELDRLLLGCSKSSLRKWRQRRAGRSREDFLNLDFPEALAYVAANGGEDERNYSNHEGSIGISHWVGPFTGDTSFGTVVQTHVDGCVDVRVAADGALLRRIHFTELRVPLRSDKTLQRLSKLDHATSADHHPLRSKHSFATLELSRHQGQVVDGLETPSSSLDPRLTVGCVVQVFTRRAPSQLSMSTKSLQYTRGEVAYVEAVSGDSFALPESGSRGLAALPAHLRILLASDPQDADDADADESTAGVGPPETLLPFHSSSVASWVPFVCTADSALASAATVTTRLSRATLSVAAAEDDEEYSEVVAERERRQELTRAFYKKMCDRLIREGDEAVERADLLGNHNNIPMKYPPEEEDLDEDEEEDPSVIAQRAKSLALDAGESESEARKRVVKQRRHLLDAAHTFKQALNRSPILDPRVFGRLSTVMLKLRNFSDALEFTAKAEKYLGASPGLVFNRGQALLGLGRFEDAFNAFDECLHPRGREDATPLKNLVDVELVRKYRNAAIVKRRKFVSAEETLALEVESSNERQRDIDQKLNVYNLYDSVPALTHKSELPRIPHPSKLVNPISRRLHVVGYPTVSSKKRMRRALRSRERSGGERRAGEASALRLPPINERQGTGPGGAGGGMASASSSSTIPASGSLSSCGKNNPSSTLFPWGDDGSSSDDDDETGGGYAWEEDDDGDADDGVLFELELETPVGVLELTVKTGDDLAVLVSDLRAKNPRALNRRQAQKLLRELKSRQRNGERDAPPAQEELL